MPDQGLITANDVAAKLKVSAQYVRSLIREGQFPALRIGTQWVMDEADLDRYIQERNIVIEPDDHVRRTAKLPKVIALSFFSGAMGLDIGLKNAGIAPLLACENDKACRMTIEKNNPDIALIGDINAYSAPEVLKMARIPEGRRVDVMFGGPPCQAFSTAGARRGLDDERGNVFLTYLSIAKGIKPTYIVVENVRGLLSAPYPFHNSREPIKGGALGIILERLRAMGYSVSFNLYNAANFGAPQSRERVVMICKLGGKKVSYLEPTNSDDPSFGLPRWRTFGQAVSTLSPKAKQHHIAFPECRLKYYRMLHEGQYWKDLPIELQREAMGKSFELGGGKTGFYRRLSFGRPSPTLVTNPTMPATDLAHPVEDRPLSVEEYGCIQEFPRDWQICGSILDQYRQIGNAVPVKLGKAIGKAIIDDMKGKKPKQIANFPYSRYRNTDEVSWQIEMDKKLRKATYDENEQASVLPFTSP